MAAGHRIGVDLGGTKIEAVSLDADGREGPRVRVPTPGGDYRGTVAAVVDAVRRAACEGGCGQLSNCRIGLGHPGSVSPRTHLHRNANSLCLNGQSLQQDIERAVGQPIRMANDANCFALSEATDGAAVGARMVFGVIIGTGVGGGVVVDGTVVAGHNGISGEWGHSPQPGVSDSARAAAVCYCGQLGCVEMFCSGGAICRDHGIGVSSESLPRIAALAELGDPPCAATIDRFLDRFAAALAVVVNILDPDAVVLGGGVSNLTGLYTPAFSARVGSRTFADGFTTPILRAKHGDSSGVRGAAALWRAGE
ncbi:MAG: ROK family protein [Phycisphaerales bacterium]|nr:ROK family protein [Phycisphaerales bacterium]